MTAISASGFRDTIKWGIVSSPEKLVLPVTATKNARQGGIAVVTSGTGTAQPATAALGLLALGRFDKSADNSASLSTAPTVEISIGTFFFNNSAAGDAITAANFGQTVYLVDDATVALTDGGETRSPAGIFMGLGVDPENLNQVAVAMSPSISAGIASAAAAKKIQSGSGVLVSGVLVVNTVIELTASSVVVVGRGAKGSGDMGYELCAVVTTPGAPSTAVLTITSQGLTGTTTATDNGTVNYIIIG